MHYSSFFFVALELFARQSPVELANRSRQAMRFNFEIFHFERSFKYQLDSRPEFLGIENFLKTVGILRIFKIREILEIPKIQNSVVQARKERLAPRIHSISLELRLTHIVSL